MKSNIRVKFKSEAAYKGLKFEGVSITIAEIRRIIFERERLDSRYNELVLSNACTKRIYTNPQEWVPKNTTIVIKRLPTKKQRRRNVK